MDIQLIEVPKEKKTILSCLMQFYFYDFSEYKGSDVLANGMFGIYPYLEDYWVDVEHRFPYFIMVDRDLP